MLRSSYIRPFSQPRLARYDLRPVFGQKHLHDLHQTAALPSLLELGQAYLRIRDVNRAEPIFKRIYGICLCNDKTRDKLLFAQTCICLARTIIIRLDQNGGLNGCNDYCSDFSHMTETVVTLLNKSMVEISSLSNQAKQLGLGLAMGCLGELIETLPEVEREDSTAMERPLYNEPISDDNNKKEKDATFIKAVLYDRIVETYVEAVALCIGSLEKSTDATTTSPTSPTTTATSNNTSNTSNTPSFDSRGFPTEDPYSGYDWESDVLVDLNRINGNATRNVIQSKTSSRYIQLSTRICELTRMRFGDGHSVVAQALYDLGCIRSDLHAFEAESKSTSTSTQSLTKRTAALGIGSSPLLPKERRITRHILANACENYISSGIWKGSTDYIACLHQLSIAAIRSCDGIEHVREQSLIAAEANLKELRQYPNSVAAVQGLAESIGVYGRIASQSGDILNAVGQAARASESMVFDNRYWYGKGGKKNRNMDEGKYRGGDSKGKLMMGKNIADVWAQGTKGHLPLWNPTWEMEKPKSVRRRHDELEGGRKLFHPDDESKREWWVPSFLYVEPSFKSVI